MNRWVLLEHKVKLVNSIDIHYDFLVEDKLDCLTWKFSKIPVLNEDYVEIYRQPNHRLVWLTRLQYDLSRNRGVVTRIDYGNFVSISIKENHQELILKLDGKLLNGLFEIVGSSC